ncbi:MAG: response regulator [candidate division KSB1 bacterium]|nr:response regulator [candidate division KSB1 bacterium]
MRAQRHKILWVDDEIDLLRPHILFLEEKGYDVTPVTNAADALTLVPKESFDLVILDEQMAGMDGLTALQEIKEMAPSLPVVMVTKSEEESLMEEAIGARIDDYLTKPVNPSQVLLVCKKFLQRKQITGERFSRNYAEEFAEISRRLQQPMGWEDWIDIHIRLCEWDIELDENSELGFRQTVADQRRECNAEFGKFVEQHYPHWLESDDRPMLSVDVVREFVAPSIDSDQRTVFLVIDNLRLDQWLVLEPLLYEYFNVQKRYYYSILPTATPYSRNAIFAGLFPAEIEAQHPDLWQGNDDDETSLNRFEAELLERQLEKLHIRLKPGLKYIKILDAKDARNAEKQIASMANLPLLALVVNFVDFLAHSRSDSQILQEIIPDEAAYRSLTRSWFLHSHVYRILKQLAGRGNRIILTSDHGSIRGMRGAKVIGDRETSTNLRYKYGRNLKCDRKYAIFVQDPATYKLPRRRLNNNYLIAKEDYYFVYPTNYHHYLNYYKDTLQHGGVSLEEMILPVVTLDPKR